MGKDFFPDREAEMVTWSQLFAERIASDPQAVGLSQEQCDAYLAVQQAFAVAYQISQSPSTRTSPAILSKNEARSAMETMSRQYARIVQSQPQVSDAQRSDLGLNIRQSTMPALPTPGEAPTLRVTAVQGAALSLWLLDSTTSGRRARPRGVAGASIFTHTGEHPPADIARWTFQGNHSNTKPTIIVADASQPFTKVWITARWYRPTCDAGPACVPVSTYTTPAGPMFASLTKAA